ncbi:hypothetical protein J0I05_00010 [Candidatus Saccharibacteria bacterium]|nr:hypothetical protein [Candidatus Saccharibacteria bacterium]
MKNTIYENQRGLLVTKGRITDELGPGVYTSFKYMRKEYFIYPTNPQAYKVSSLSKSKDNASFAVDIPTMITISDIRAYYKSGVLYHSEATRICSKLIQTIVGSLTLAEILEARLELDAEQLNTELAQYGLSITIDGPIMVRLPRTLQNAIDAQEVARQKAKAEIEEARGRTAVLRHYANTAKLTKDNPDLLRLLLGQKAKAINVAFDAKG